MSKPIIRPSGKVELEDGTDARLLASGRERTVTFRLYYFAKDRDRPKLENLAVRSAIGGERFWMGSRWRTPIWALTRACPLP